MLRIYAGPHDRIIGFARSTLNKSEFKGADDEHMVIGRPKPDFKP